MAITPAVHWRLLQNTQQIVLNLGLNDLPATGAGIADNEILLLAFPVDPQIGVPGVGISLADITETYEDETITYFNATAPTVPLVGYYVTRPVKVEIWDLPVSPDTNWQTQLQTWLLWRQTLVRGFLQPGLVEEIKAGSLGQPAVPELARIVVHLGPIITSTVPERRQFLSGLTVDYECSECGLIDTE
jgi:hypothetical protein